MAQLSMWMQETLLWVSLWMAEGSRLGFQGIHPGLHTSRQVQNCTPKPGEVAEEQHCCYPLLCTYLQSGKGGGVYDTTCLLCVCWAFNVSIISIAVKTAQHVRWGRSSTWWWRVHWERAAGPRCSRLHRPPDSTGGWTRLQCAAAPGRPPSPAPWPRQVLPSARAGG